MHRLLNNVALRFANSSSQWTLLKRFNETSSNTCQPIPDVPGLSTKIVNVPIGEEVGPGASKDGIYKNPEYYCYDSVSFFEAEIEMKKYRLPQPSNKKV